MTSTKKTNNKRNYTSIAITVAIVLMLVLSGPASAVTLGISLDNNSPTKGDFITFTVTAEINDPDKYVPIDNFSLSITGDTNKEFLFNTDGTPISSGITVVAINSPSSDDYGHGYRYGYDSNIGYGYSFGYGYGYGYGYGSGIGGHVTYEYEITLDTTDLNTGSHSAILKLNTGKSVKPSFSSSTVPFTVTAAGSGGSSGSGTYPTTTTSMTQTKTVASIGAGGNASFSFTKTAINGIEITVKNGVSNVIVTVEKLLTQPSSIPDVLFEISGSEGSKMNIYGYLAIDVNIDNSNIESAEISFKVPKSWLDENNIDKITLARFNKETSKWEAYTAVMSVDGNGNTIVDNEGNVVFTATTPGFSTFAIIGEEIIAATDTVTPPKETISDDESTLTDVADEEEPESKSSVTLIVIVLLLAIIAGVAYYKRDEINKLLKK